MSEFVIPRCDHGNIILGCPDDDCEKQNAYLLEQAAALDRFQAYQREEAARIVRQLLLGSGRPQVNKRYRIDT